MKSFVRILRDTCMLQDRIDDLQAFLNRYVLGADGLTHFIQDAIKRGDDLCDPAANPGSGA